MITKRDLLLFLSLIVIATVVSFIPYFLFFVFAYLIFSFIKIGNEETYTPVLTPTKTLNEQARKTNFQAMKRDYMHSQAWDEKRKECLHIHHYKCTSCNARNKPLDVHHTSGYNKVPFEPVSCLVALCRDCHDYQHTIYGFPQTYDEYMNWNAPLVHKS